MQTLPMPDVDRVPRRLPRLEVPKTGIVAMIAGFNVRSNGQVLKPGNTVDHGPVTTIYGFGMDFQVERRLEEVSSSGIFGPPSLYPEFIVAETDGWLTIEWPRPTKDLWAELSGWDLTAIRIVHSGRKFEGIGALNQSRMEWKRGRYEATYRWQMVDLGSYNLSWPEPMPPIALPPIALP